MSILPYGQRLQSSAKILDPIMSKRFRLALGARDGWHCHYCNKPFDDEADRQRRTYRNPDPRNESDDFIQPPFILERAGLDHKIPQCLGGQHTMENLVLCCGTCNGKKYTKDYATFLASVRQT